MNKVFKVIWNEARNAYVVVSEIAKNRGSKSCSTKKLLAMLIATGVMTCASFDVLAAQPTPAETARYQYVAFGDKKADLINGQEQTINGHKYIYDATNKYWVREGYKLTVDENGKLHTPLSAHGKAADVAYIGGGDTGSILQSVTSMVSASGTVTNMGESLSRITASAFTGVSHSGGTAVVGDWNYIIQDSSWQGYVENGNFQDGYVDLSGPEGGMPKGFVTVGDKLKWDDTKQAYTYNGKPVDYSNVYVIDGKIGVFTNQSGSDFYKGTVFGKNNEILMTVKDGDHFYSYWAAEVTDPSATMQSYRLAEYKKDLAVLVENDNKLSRDDIKEVTLDTSKANSATISLLRNGDKAVDGAITVTSGGGTEGSDTFVKISNGTANQTFATGSMVEAIGTTEATTGIKINGQEYTIKDTDTKYTAGENVTIDTNNKISVDLSQYAKTVDVAVVYNDKNSLHSTNSGKVGEKAIAFGQNAIADGNFSVAIGDSANIDANSVYTSSGAYSTAVGAASGAWGTQAAAVGYNAKAAGRNAVALGYSASASATDSVAIGASSIANREAGTVGLYAPTGTNDSTWKATSGAVSIGKSGTTRQIINLAAGTADTDAVNVAQLKKVKAEADKHTTLVAGANVTLNEEKTENGLKYTISATGTNYTAGNGIAIDTTNNTISVKLQADSNLEVSEQGLTLKKQLTGMQSIQGAGEGKISFDGANVKVNNTTFSENSVVVGGGTDGKTPVTINGTDGVVSGLHNTNIGYTDFATRGNAATEEQLKKVMDAGWKFTTDSGTQTTVTVGEAGNEVKFNGDAANIEVTNTDKDIKVALKKDLTVDSVKAGETTVNTNGLTIGTGATGIVLNKTNVSMGGQQIHNVAAGTVDTDAVNFGQLKETNTKVENLKVEAGKHTTLVKGENTTVEKIETADGHFEYKVNAVDTKYTAGNGIAIDTENNNAISVKLQDGSNLVVNSNGLALNTALTGIESINGTGAGSISFNGGNVKVNQNTFNSDGRIKNVANGTETKDAVNFGQLDATNKKVDNLTTEVGKGWTVATENGTATKVGAGDTVKFSGADDNIKVSNTGKDVKVELNKNLTVDSVKAGDFFMDKNEGVGYKGKAYITSSGLNANNQKITGVAAGTISADSTDAVNGSQLYDVKNSINTDISNKTFGLEDDKGNKATNTLGNTVQVKGADGITSTVKDGALEIGLKLQDNSNLVVNGNGLVLNTALTGIQSINGAGGTINLAGSAITINETTFNKDGRIQNVAAGTETKDAVNFGQLDATNKKVDNLTTEVGKGWTVATENGTATKVGAGDTVKFSGADDNIKVSNAGNKVSFKLNNKLTGIESIAGVGGGSISFSGGNVTINNNVTFGSNGQIHNVTAGTASTDAVNVGQLNAAVQAGNTDTHIKPGEYGVGADNKVNMDVVDKNGNKVDTVTIKDVAKASDVGDVNNIASDIKNQDGSHTTVVDAVNNLNNKLDNKVGDLQYSKVDKGDIADGDSTTTAIGKLDQKLNDVAATAAKQHTTVSGSGNIVVEDPTINADGGKNYNVKLADDINVNSVTANTFKADKTIMDKDGLKVGEKVSVTENAVTAGKTSISDEGVKVGDKTYISDKGLNANGQNITNVADGKVEKDSKDAINGGQLFDTETKINNRIDGVENQVISNSNRIGQLSSRVNKVGAGAAALAALHPMDFDPDDKLTFSAGYGNYAGQNAAAIGAYYRPDEKVMFSVGGTVGNGENMVNAGISFSLDRTNHVSNSRTALAREVIELRGQLAEMGAKMAKMEKAFGMLDESKTKLFPDIPANHWAYEYIAKLAGNGILEGYPDGSFGGDRLMTRYEFATMLYRAIENGAALEERIIKEFEPELGRIRVDRISGDDGDRKKIERVRVNDTKGERDHYGNKLAK